MFRVSGLGFRNFFWFTGLGVWGLKFRGSGLECGGLALWHLEVGSGV